jgi:hypothetical protein
MSNYYSSYSIPSPAVVFSRNSTNAFWERRRQKAENEINANIVARDEDYTKLMIQLGNRLIALGNIERQKEMNLIRAACPDFAFSDAKEFIKAFNTIMQGKQQTEEAISRIKAALNVIKNSKEQTPAPHVASFFSTYLQSTLTSEINSFVRSHLNDLVSNPSAFKGAWDTQYNKMIDRAIDAAVKKMFSLSGTDKQKELYGDSETWKAILQLYNSLPTFSVQFKSMIRTRLGAGLDRLKADLIKEINANNFGKRKRKTGVSTIVDKKLNLGNQRGQIGGSVYEYLQTLVNMSGTVTEHGTTVVGGEGVKTDMISVFNFTGDFSVSLELMEDLNKTLSASRSLEQARTDLEQFYQRNFTKLNNQFIVYTSAKMYTLRKSFSGFKNGSSQPLERLPQYIAEAGMSIDNAQDFLATAYNTVDGAIYASMRSDVENNLRLILTNAAAKLLFDDFSTIGTETIGGTTGQAIHAFALGGVYLPSSELFIQLGTALLQTASNFTRWVNVNVHIAYSQTEYQTSGPDDDVKPAIFEAWNHNIESARRSSYFTVKFLANFNSIFNSLF